jgi:hypothetical protein
MCTAKLPAPPPTHAARSLPTHGPVHLHVYVYTGTSAGTRGSERGHNSRECGWLRGGAPRAA